jgi:GWxTD domain-containing protein
MAKPTKSLINPDSELLEVNSIAYHLNDSMTSVFFEVINENLIYKRPDTSAAFYAEVKVNYKLYGKDNNRKILDSSSIFLYDRADENVTVKSLVSSFDIKAFSGNDYNLEIQLYDVNKKIIYNTRLYVNKKNSFSDQNFLVLRNNQVCFKTNFLKDEKVLVKFSNIPINQLTVDYFSKDFGPALPPFSLKQPDELKYKPDSSFAMLVSSNQFELTMPQSGFYHVKPSPKNYDGLTLYTYDETFPGVSNIEEMIYCTRYIMNKQEFENSKNAEDKKAAIDNFWKEIGGSNERAKQLLKRYYGRVKEANKYYTGYTQGWKTDRGMIFIVFGKPTNIYTNLKNEIWVYGTEPNPNSTRFTFNRTDNPFTENDFILERTQFFKDSWYAAVDFWRQGNVYLDGKR